MKKETYVKMTQPFRDDPKRARALHRTAICDSKRYERTFLAEPACVFRDSDCIYVLVCVPGCGDCILAYDSCYCMDPGSFRSALYQ